MMEGSCQIARGYDKKSFFGNRFRGGMTLSKSPIFRIPAVMGVCLVVFFLAGAQKKGDPKPRLGLTERLLDALEWRCIGPAIMGGRIDDFAVVENDPDIIYAATASGGLW